MTGYQLHDSETEEVLGSVVITHQDIEVEKPYDALYDGWEDFNKLEESEGDTNNVDEFITWFNANHVTQIDRLYLEFIQH